MKPLRPAENKQVEFIKDCLRKGEQRKEILPKFTKTYKTSPKTFDNRLKIAQKAIQDEQELIKRESEKGVAKQIEEMESKIMTATERRLYLTEIINGKVEIPYTEVKWDAVQKKFVTIKFVELAPHNARIAAIAELNKMDGDYAPKKTDLTSNGKEITIHFKDAE